MWLLDAIKILGSTGEVKKVITDRVEKSADAQNLLAAYGRGTEWFVAICHTVCLLWCKEQDIGRCESIKVEISEEEEYYATCAWYWQSTPTFGASKLSALCTDTLSTETTSVTPWAWTASLERTMSASSLAFSCSYHNPSCKHACGQHCWKKWPQWFRQL